MATIEIAGWNVGFSAVGIIKILRQEFGFSLSDAHFSVGELLEGKKILLVASVEKTEDLISRMRALGANVKSLV